MVQPGLCCRCQCLWIRWCLHILRKSTKIDALQLIFVCELNSNRFCSHFSTMINRDTRLLLEPMEELLENAERKTMVSNTLSCRFREFVMPEPPISLRISCSRCFTVDTPVSTPMVMVKRVLPNAHLSSTRHGWTIRSRPRKWPKRLLGPRLVSSAAQFLESPSLKKKRRRFLNLHTSSIFSNVLSKIRLQGRRIPVEHLLRKVSLNFIVQVV